NIHRAMQALAQESPRAARIVEMGVFGGMSEQEIAGVLGVSRPTVSRDWATAKLWLARYLSAFRERDDEHATTSAS
ncbi:ECF-type sigma factor, partial [Xanthomonadaceae bacterium JHOS43]|nr:ECF-type sigma factor [Xanthomonadaceae bacterium JHOS43]